MTEIARCCPPEAPRRRPVWAPVPTEEALAHERQIAQRLVGAAASGAQHGGAAGVETGLAPAMLVCYAVPFLLNFTWGFVLTLLTLLGAGLYGLRRLWWWLCTAK